MSSTKCYLSPRSVSYILKAQVTSPCQMLLSMLCFKIVQLAQVLAAPAAIRLAHNRLAHNHRVSSVLRALMETTNSLLVMTSTLKLAPSTVLRPNKKFKTPIVDLLSARTIQASSTKLLFPWTGHPVKTSPRICNRIV